MIEYDGIYTERIVWDWVCMYEFERVPRSMACIVTVGWVLRPYGWLYMEFVTQSAFSTVSALWNRHCRHHHHHHQK